MARIDFWSYFLDDNGNPLKNVEVRVYLAGTFTEADIYLDSAFGSVTNSSTENLKTDKFGFVQFWIGDEWEIEGGYNVSQQFRVVWQNTVDGRQEEIDNLYIFTPVRPIEITDSIKGVPSNKDIDKVISNAQGYKWNTHVDSIVPSASPHGLKPVDFFDLDSVQNRVISDKLGYQMYQMARTASTIPIDVSAARFYTETINSWSTSGGLFYQNVNHNFNNRYPIVRVSKTSNNNQIQAENIQSISPDTIRVWLEENISLNVVIFG